MQHSEQLVDNTGQLFFWSAQTALTLPTAKQAVRQLKLLVYNFGWSLVYWILKHLLCESGFSAQLIGHFNYVISDLHASTAPQLHRMLD